MKRVQIAIAAGSVAALGAIAATVWVGVSVREDTVVARPYEDGLRQDAERHARAALGLAVSIRTVAVAGVAPLVFELNDRAGNPVDDAAITVEISRPDTSRGERSAPARALGAGRWTADLAFPGPGQWDVRFDVVRGKDRVRLERRVGVGERCDVAQRACSGVDPRGGLVVLEVSPRPVRAMTELAVRVSSVERVRGGPLRPSEEAAPAWAPTVSVAFTMSGMPMGENRSRLAPTEESARLERRLAGGDGVTLVYEGKAVLVRCASGRRDWTAEVELAYPDGDRRTFRFPLTLPEDAR